MDKLLAAVHMSMKEFGFLLDRLERACQSCKKFLCEVEEDCEFSDMWSLKQLGPLTISEALEWIEDFRSFAQKEFEFKHSLASIANYENSEKIAELWISQPFLGCNRIRDRIEQIKVISMTEIKADLGTKF